MSQFIYNRPFSSKNQILPEVTLPDIILFMGDLNYRINGYKPSIMQAMGKDRYDLLINSEQLLMEKQLGNIPSFLLEGHIAFAPTFKRKPFDNS